MYRMHLEIAIRSNQTTSTTHTATTEMNYYQPHIRFHKPIIIAIITIEQLINSFLKQCLKQCFSDAKRIYQ